MRKLLLMILIIQNLFCALSYAKILVVRKNDNSTAYYKTSLIDSITYQENPPQKMIIHQPGATNISYDLSEIDSVSFIDSLYRTVYTTTNLAGHTLVPEFNPGGGTNCDTSSQDIAMEILDDYAVVTSNVRKQNVWVNAIAGKKFINNLSENTPIVYGTYRLKGEFKIPVIPNPDLNQEENGGGMHFLLQFWDGDSVYFKQYKTAIEATLYWHLNPWDTDILGDIMVYTTNLALHNTGITIPPDNNWHSFEMIADLSAQMWVSVTVDGQTADLRGIPVALLERPTWGNELAVTITQESLATWPGANCDVVFWWRTFFRNLEFSYLLKD